METSGLDPEITICKIVVLPVKLCPLKEKGKERGKEIKKRKERHNKERLASPRVVDKGEGEGS